jgi:hypothetical protein
MPEAVIGSCRKAGVALFLVCLLLPTSALAILGGAPGERDPAIAGSTVAIVIEDTSKPGPDGRPGYYPSTGIVVARDWILTVKHAFADHNGPQYVWSVHLAPEIRIGASDARVRRLDPVSVVFHPTLDLALIHIDAAMPFEYKPARLVADGRHLARDAVFKGLLAGYGPIRGQTAPNRLNFVEEPISAISLAMGRRWPDLVARNQAADHLELDQRDGRGSCSGDSGGPVFVRLASGELGLLGVIRGNASYTGAHPCLGYSYAVRVDRVIGWLAQITGRIYNPDSMLLVDAFTTAATTRP